MRDTNTDSIADNNTDTYGYRNRNYDPYTDTVCYSYTQRNAQSNTKTASNSAPAPDSAVIGRGRWIIGKRMRLACLFSAQSPEATMSTERVN